jgi:predicted signal transduction protein with EAL and GGDEF domain
VGDIELRARVAFQPMIDLAIGAVVAHEALATHGRHGRYELRYTDPMRAMA